MALPKFVQCTKTRSNIVEIKRDSYLEQLKIRKDNGMIKIITGIRRCGKSFLLFVLFKKYLLESGVDNDHILEIALDGIENEELRDPKKCYQHIKERVEDDQKYYLLLDEVQFMRRYRPGFAPGYLVQQGSPSKAPATQQFIQLSQLS